MNIYAHSEFHTIGLLKLEILHLCNKHACFKFLHIILDFFLRSQNNRNNIKESFTPRFHCSLEEHTCVQYFFCLYSLTNSVFYISFHSFLCTIRFHGEYEKLTALEWCCDVILMDGKFTSEETENESIDKIVTKNTISHWGWYSYTKASTDMYILHYETKNEKNWLDA